MRLTCFAANTTNTPIAELELRHRQRARAEDRIRAARATGLRNLPLHDTAQNQLWLEIVQIALDLLTWMPMLALTGAARLWEPRRLRLRLSSTAAHFVTTGRRRILRIAAHWPWTDVITQGGVRCQGDRSTAEPLRRCRSRFIRGSTHPGRQAGPFPVRAVSPALSSGCGSMPSTQTLHSVADCHTPTRPRRPQPEQRRRSPGSHFR